MANRTVIADVVAMETRLGDRNKQPFFWARLRRMEADVLISNLRLLDQPGSRKRYYLTCKVPDPRRLKLINFDRTPQYEQDAALNYARGDVFTVSGNSQSCNVAFSAVAAGLLAAEMAAAAARCREWIEIVVPNRRGKLNLLEFIADTDRKAAVEQESIGRAGEHALAEILPREDFSDWEQHP